MSNTYRPTKPKQARKNTTNIATMGQSTHNVEEDGYGKHMSPMKSLQLMPVRYCHANGVVV